jgi:Fe2+ transport system protein FeoA
MQHAAGIRELTAGDPLLSRLIRLGFIDGLNRALAQLEADTPMLHGTVN